jgi:hypothetical protein
MVLPEDVWKKVVTIEKARLFFQNTCMTSVSYYHVLCQDPETFVTLFKLQFLGKLQYNWSDLFSYLLAKAGQPLIQSVLAWANSVTSTIKCVPKYPTTRYQFLQIQRFVYRVFTNKIGSEETINDQLKCLLGIELYFVPNKDL